MVRRQQSKRKRNTRLPLKKIIILTEGKRTEPNYFKHFKKRSNLIEIKINNSPHTDAQNIYKYANNRNIWKEWHFDEKGGDVICCVFDKDRNADSIMESIYLDSLKKEYLYIFPSNPCIEVWFLLHFLKSNQIPSNQTPQEIKKRLSNYIKKYSENLDVFYDLKPSYKLAFDRSLKIAAKTQEKDNFQTGLIDPSTTIPYLLEKIRTMYSYDSIEDLFS